MKWLFRLVLVALAVPGPASAGFEYEGDDLSISQLTNARIYSLFLGLRPADAQTETDSALLVQRVRPTATVYYGNYWGLDVAWDLVPVIGNTQALSLALAPANPLRIDDFDSTLHTGDGWVLQHNLDQLNVRYLHESFEVRLGRQSIGHGSARIFPASDFFSSISPAAIDNEFKRGVDAVRFTMPVGESSEFEAYAVGNKSDLADGLFLGRWRSSFVDLLDVSVLGGMTFGKPTVGLDLSGDLGGAGWYVDAAMRLDVDDVADGSFWRATAGIDYRFLSGIRVLFEVHHNGPGELDPQDYLAVLSKAPYTQTEIFLLGQYYAALAAFFEVTPLLLFNATWLQNLTDGSALALPSLSWDFGEGTTLGVGGILSLGDRGYDISGTAVAPRSEFGLSPHTFFTDVRVVF